MRIARTVSIFLALVVSAFAIAACGGDNSSSSSSDAEAVLKQTFGPDHPIKSGKLDLALNLDLKGVARLTDPVALRLSGPFQSNGAGTLPNFQFTLDVDAGGKAFSAGAVSTGKAGYLTFEGQSFDIGTELYNSFKQGYENAAKQAKSKSASGTPSLGALGIEPINWLNNAETKGEEDIAGTTTEHVSAEVDVPKFLDDVSRLLSKAQGLNVQGAGAVPKSLTPEQRRDIARSVKSATVDVWSGKDDKTLRKLALDVQLDVPEDVRSKVGNLQSGRITFQFTIANLNEPQTVTAPSGARPLSELTQALQQLGLGGASSGANGSGSGGSGSGGSGSGSSGSGSSSGASGKQADYLNCLQKAGTDVAKIQGCADKLQP
jgi:hypothetical protein